MLSLESVEKVWRESDCADLEDKLLVKLLCLYFWTRLSCFFRSANSLSLLATLLTAME